jgi:hypothetical protein
MLLEMMQDGICFRCESCNTWASNTDTARRMQSLTPVFEFETPFHPLVGTAHQRVAQ